MDLSPDHVTLDSGQLRWDSNLLKNPDSMPDFQSGKQNKEKSFYKHLSVKQLKKGKAYNSVVTVVGF